MGEIPNSKKYGVPLYGAGWVPRNAGFVLQPPKEEEEQGDGGNGSRPAAGEVDNHVVLAGGGGAGSSGIRNALLIAKFDPDSNILSNELVAKLETGEELPYRIAVHPAGEGLICSFTEFCRWYEWAAIESADGCTLGLRSSERSLNDLQAVGQQLALAFNSEGSLLATGGEDGKLRVFKWPSMESVIFDKAKAHTSVKYLTFSPDGKFLVSVGSGPARVWDLTSSTAVASLQRGSDEIFCFSKFSESTDENQVLYIIAMQGQGASVSKWSTTSWKKMNSNRITRDAVSAFDVSNDGNILGVGTIQGDILVVSSKSLRVTTVVKKAHLGLVTALTFSHDSRYLVSASMDSSARITQMKDKKKDGSKFWILVFMIVFAIAAFLIKSKELLPQQLERFLKI